MTINNESITGRNYTWYIIKKMAEGDAGEIFLVESSHDQQQAVLKRPQKSVFTGEVRRQAEQIRTEGKIIKGLEELFRNNGVEDYKVPRLLDQSLQGTEYSDRFFIVIEKAAGFDLNRLMKVATVGVRSEELELSHPIEERFLNEVSKTGKIPDRIILDAIYTLFSLFDCIHDITYKSETFNAVRILWNDVKPDHLFWNPQEAKFTIIDWGNGQINEEGELERKLKHTPYEDRRQFIEEIKRFLNQASPELMNQLKWPDKVPGLNNFEKSYEILRRKTKSLRNNEIKKIKTLRKRELELIKHHPQVDESLSEIDEIYRQIYVLGEIPNYPKALKMVGEMINTLSEYEEFERVKNLCVWAAYLPGAPNQIWLLLAELCGSSLSLPEKSQKKMFEALKAASANKWEDVLWLMVTSLGSEQEPDWWYELTRQVRLMAANQTANRITPLLFVKRLNLTLQSNYLELEEIMAKTPSEDGEKRLKNIQKLLDRIKNTIQNWVQLEPAPPYSGISYEEIESLLSEIEKIIPGAGVQMQQVLELPGEQVAHILDEWNKKEFDNAEIRLRRLLILDPDRRRLVKTERALKTAPNWIKRVQAGPLDEEHLTDFATNLEYEGRELKNEIGSAEWLDKILDGLKSIRQGTWPGDLVLDNEALIDEIPWIKKYVRQEVLFKIKNPNQIFQPLYSIPGVKETHYGPDNEITFVEPLDAWIPEARGSSARVYSATYRANDGELREGALKIMRLDKLDYAMPLFIEETRVFNVINDIPGVNRLIECGFLWMGGKDAKLPGDYDRNSIKSLHGDIQRIGPDSLDRFWDQMDQQVNIGWTPYILLEKRKKEECLINLCDASVNHGHFMKTPELLFMSIQICEVLDAVHRRNVIYRDHKILHYYWHTENNGISVIDWNVAKYLPDGLTDYDVQMDLVQFGARGLHHILTGRTAPGALPLGPTRPEEIEQSARSYSTAWTYDDMRLNDDVKNIIENVLSGKYKNAFELKDILKKAYMNWAD